MMVPSRTASEDTDATISTSTGVPSGTLIGRISGGFGGSATGAAALASADAWIIAKMTLSGIPARFSFCRPSAEVSNLVGEDLILAMITSGPSRVACMLMMFLFESGTGASCGGGTVELVRPNGVGGGNT